MQLNFENKIEDQFDTDGGGNKSIISGSKTGSTTFTIAGLNYQSKLLLTCVKTADLLTTAQFSGMMCVKNVLLRTSPWYFPQLGQVAQI